MYLVKDVHALCDAYPYCSFGGAGSVTRANAPGGWPRDLATVVDGEFGPHMTIDIASRSLRSRRGRLRGKILRLRRDARRSARARRASDEGAVARANGPGGWPRDLAVMLDGEVGPRLTIYIARRSLR